MDPFFFHWEGGTGGRALVFTAVLDSDPDLAIYKLYDLVATSYSMNIALLIPKLVKSFTYILGLC